VERVLAFREAGVTDPTVYADRRVIVAYQDLDLVQRKLYLGHAAAVTQARLEAATQVLRLSAPRTDTT
jgi:hypothetical protein